MLFHLFAHSLGDSCLCPDPGSNMQPWRIRKKQLSYPVRVCICLSSPSRAVRRGLEGKHPQTARLEGKRGVRRPPQTRCTALRCLPRALSERRWRRRRRRPTLHTRHLFAGRGSGHSAPAGDGKALCWRPHGERVSIRRHGDATKGGSVGERENRARAECWVFPCALSAASFSVTLATSVAPEDSLPWAS